MATVGVLISTAIIGAGFWLAAMWLGIPLPFVWALVFGALISPTDPVAVLSTLKRVKVPLSLEIIMTGESLFNDGVGWFGRSAYAVVLQKGMRRGDVAEWFNTGG